VNFPRAAGVKLAAADGFPGTSHGGGTNGT
jgi:hypothetical protein